MRIDRADPAAVVVEEERGAFPATHWSVVLRAGQKDSGEALAALETLCGTYWYPVYCFIRRQGRAREDAEDLTQEFFARILGKNDLRSVDPAKGRFRSFLLACLKHFLCNEWDKSQCQKRGSAFEHISIDFAYADNRYHFEPAHEVSPDWLFERNWVEVLLQNVLDKLRREYLAAGKGELFEAIQPYLEGECEDLPYAETARRLGMGLSGVKMAVLRLRRRYGELLLREIGDTVGNPGEAHDEIRYLFGAIG
jgi:DNA-directed RNA polymerase specialized sigma24 family protein